MVKWDRNYKYNIPLHIPVDSQEKLEGNMLNICCDFSLNCKTVCNFNLFGFFMLIELV